MIAKKLPSIDFLNSLFDLDFATGKLTWRSRPLSEFTSQRSFSTWNARFCGKEAGSADHLGYIRVCISNNGKRDNYLAHRIVYKMFYGEEPETIDHKNMNPSDNKPPNLRGASFSENGCNRKGHVDAKVPVKGIDMHAGKFRCRIRKDGRQIHLGLFDAIEDARRAYNDAATELHKDFKKTA
jgi:hypothetical protein